MTSKEYERAHDFKPRSANARVISTTSVELNIAVPEGRFRSELLLALEVVRIDLPPLRKRPEDLHSMAEKYLAFFSREHRRRIAGFTPDAMRLLAGYHWPGNTREPRNLIERAVILCAVDQIGVGQFPPEFAQFRRRVFAG